MAISYRGTINYEVEEKFRKMLLKGEISIIIISSDGYPKGIFDNKSRYDYLESLNASTKHLLEDESSTLKEGSGDEIREIEKEVHTQYLKLLREADFSQAIKVDDNKLNDYDRMCLKKGVKWYIILSFDKGALGTTKIDLQNMESYQALKIMVEKEIDYRDVPKPWDGIEEEKIKKDFTPQFSAHLKDKYNSILKKVRDELKKQMESTPRPPTIPGVGLG